MAELTVQPKIRLLSLDVFRGITMAAMILVNNPGNWKQVYAPLDHAEWNGWTPTDLIFPFFLFMVGVSIVFAMESKKADPATHGTLIWKAFRRMITLIAITMLTRFIYHHDLSTIRFPGVLQRIAVVYFICTLLYLTTSAKTRYWIFALVLIGYYLIMTLVPVPDYGPANLEPSTNLGAWLDRLVFTTQHLWAESKTWDPEGLLSTLPAIGTGLFGIAVGTWLKRTDHDSGNKVSWMLTYGMLALTLGFVCDWFFPINKKLWTSSFVLFTGGLATMALGMAYWLIDVHKHRRFTSFFSVFGTNAIVAYILSDILPSLLAFIKLPSKGKSVGFMRFVGEQVFEPVMSPKNASLAGAVLLVLIIWLILYPLYRKKIMIKI
jgi:predicted acyltransferase